MYAIGCELLALAVVVVGFLVEPGRPADALWFGVLLFLGGFQAEMSRKIERMRRWMGGQTHINVTSVWYVAGAVLLSPGWVALLAVTLYVHLWLRVWRGVRTRPAHRVIASTAWALLSCYAASAVVRLSGLGGLSQEPSPALRGALAVLVAAAVFELVNALVVSFGIHLLTGATSLGDLLGTPEDNALEAVTLCLGGIAALALAYQPVLVVLVFPPLLFLHRHVLFKQLEVAAVTDEKTGLLNTAGWHGLATRELDRVRRKSGGLGVLMVDLDHFKKINDTYGHLAGDDVLKAVAAAASAAVRETDTVGRFGGEEFVVLLPDIDAADVIVVAERVREAISLLSVPVSSSDGVVINGISASIGVAMYPDAGVALERLLAAADVALYQAKSEGRNRVVRV